MNDQTEQRERIKRGRKKENLEDCVVSAEQREGFYKSELIHFGFYDEEGQSLIKPSELNKEEIELRHKLNSWINAKNQRKQSKEIEICGTVNAEVLQKVTHPLSQGFIESFIRYYRPLLKNLSKLDRKNKVRYSDQDLLGRFEKYFNAGQTP